MAEKKTFQFDFTVEDVTDELAEAMLDVIIAIAEASGASVGGGFHEYVDDAEASGEDDDGEETS